MILDTVTLADIIEHHSVLLGHCRIWGLQNVDLWFPSRTQGRLVVLSSVLEEHKYPSEPKAEEREF